MKSISIFLFLLITLASNAQDNKTSGLNARQFHKYWKVESESPDYKVTFRGDTAEILSPKGLTLWRKEKMSGKVTIGVIRENWFTRKARAQFPHPAQKMPVP